MPEFKLNGKTYSGSTSYASAIDYTEADGSKTTVQDKISEIDENISEQNKNLIKNDLGEAIIISTSCNSLNNSYVFEEDGYLTIYSPTANVGDYITGYLCSSTTSHKIYLIAQCMKAGYPNVKTVYVKKGMRFYFDSTTGEAQFRYLQ